VGKTLESDDERKRGEVRKPLSSWIGNLLAKFLMCSVPKGVEFAMYSIDYYHCLRNYLYIKRNWKAENVDRHPPRYAKQIVSEYESEISGFPEKQANYG